MRAREPARLKQKEVNKKDSSSVTNLYVLT